MQNIRHFGTTHFRTQSNEFVLCGVFRFLERIAHHHGITMQLLKDIRAWLSRAVNVLQDPGEHLVNAIEVGEPLEL